MTIRPLPLPGWAMRALAEERLTQWRVPLKVQPPEWAVNATNSIELAGFVEWHGHPDGLLRLQKLPVAPGDALWVQESHYLTDDGHDEYAVYAADAADVAEHLAFMEKCGLPPELLPKHTRKRSPVTMPRRFSRWTLTVESVMVERAWSATETDAMAMGLPPLLVPPDGGSCPHLEALEEYWRKRHGPGAWERNDWCAVAVWRAERRNVDVG